MKKSLSLIFIVLFFSCNGPKLQPKNGIAQSPADSIKQKSIDSQMALGDRPDSEQDGPTFEEVLATEKASYNQIKRADTLIIDGKDSLQVHFKLYCLKNTVIKVPKTYFAPWGGKIKTDYIGHDFASYIIIIKNRDTILNKTFTKKDFLPALDDVGMKKYAVPFDGKFRNYNQTLKDEFLFGYSVTIPLTDVGVAAYIAVDTKGNYKILDEYAIKD